MNKNKICKTLLIALIFNVVSINLCFSQDDTRWWNESETPHLNVIKDLKQGRGRIWYVDGKNGSDERGDGSSWKAPWKTISKVFNYYKGRPGPGDTVVIASGTYRERVSIRSRGMADNPILIGPVGNGEIIIDASRKIDGWEIYKGKVYKASCLFEPTSVVVDEQPLFPEFSLNKVNAGKWYYDGKAKLLYLHIPTGEDPSLHDVGVINNNERENALFLNNADYVTVYGVTIKYAGGYGISVLGNYNRIEKCDVKFNGKGGIQIWPYGNTIATGNQVVKNHIYHNMLRNWPRGRYKSGLWAAGAGGRGENTQFIGNVVHKNGGEGLLAYTGKGGTIFRDNIVYDNWSVNIYVDRQPNCIIERNFIYSNEPDAHDLYNNGDKNPNDNKNFRRLRAEGIMTADENNPAAFKNAIIINNIIIGCRRGITHYGKASDSGLKNILVAHNTIIVPEAKGAGENYIGISVPYNNGNNNNAVYRNNIVYASHPSTYLLYISTGPKSIKDPFHGLTFANNLWYHKNNPKPFRVGPKWMDIYAFDFKRWQKKYKSIEWRSGDIYAEPKFTDVKKFSADGLIPKVDSPAINAGIPMKEVTDDYFNNPRDLTPDIGAFEFISTDLTKSFE